MKKALISPLENNRVAQVEQESFEVALPLFWVDCPDEVTTEWTYDGSAFNAPVQPDPIAVPTQTKAELLAQLQELTAKIEALGEV
jgi:hypothetical protein